MSFFEDVWSRNFLNIFGSPMKISEYIGGMVLTGILRSLLALGAMLILATAAFGLHIFVYGAQLALFILVLFLFGIVLGIIGISLVLRFGPSAEWFVWPIPAFISPFVGVIYPISVLPHWMQLVGKILPPSYVFNAIRVVSQGGHFPAGNLLIAIFLSLLYILLAYALFVAVYKKAVRTGLIARYSAETTN